MNTETTKKTNITKNEIQYNLLRELQKAIEDYHKEWATKERLEEKGTYLPSPSNSRILGLFEIMEHDCSNNDIFKREWCGAFEDHYNYLVTQLIPEHLWDLALIIEGCDGARLYHQGMINALKDSFVPLEEVSVILSAFKK